LRDAAEIEIRAKYNLAKPIKKPRRPKKGQTYVDPMTLVR
jgi:hypothetical protein